jgi:hypothetical protein
MPNALRTFIVPAVILIAACTAISQQKSQTPVSDNLDFHNLQVLSPNLTHDELVSTMRGIARSLGTRCNHCHVANPPGAEEEFNYASDAKPEKKVARTMLRMVRNINADYISKVNAHGKTVTCYTCHRGQTVPETTPPAAPEH